MTEPRSEPSPIPFDNSFADQMEGFFVPARAALAPGPRLIAFNRELAVELGIDLEAFCDDRLARVFSGQEILPDSDPLAQVYAGHQFGHFVPRLGDGRALLLGEVVDAHGRRRDIQLKGSGPTHFSRGGDGLSPIGPVLREYLVSEAMHALGVPTTRALAAVATGQTVYREEPLPGAVFTRVAASHLRVGTFEYFAARRDPEGLKQLVEYAIRRHDADLAEAPDRVPLFLARVCERQAELLAHWMCLGFVHGVMNTDNTSISGETIDFGPCAFMERYDPETVFSSIDRDGRYAYGRQPYLALWNLSRLAEALLSLFEGEEQANVERATDIVEGFGPLYEQAWLARMRRKLGLATELAADRALIEGFLQHCHAGGADFTRSFRALAALVEGDPRPLTSEFAGATDLGAWIERYRQRIGTEPRPEADRAREMRLVNPLYIPRNHRVEAALTAAAEDDLQPFETLLEVLRLPFEEQPGRDDYARPAPPDDAPYVTFCGT